MAFSRLFHIPQSAHLAIWLCTLLAACGGGGGGGGGGGTTPTVATFMPGNRSVVVGPQVIGSGGGTLAAPAGSALAGIVVTIPAGALSAPRSVSLSSDDGTLATVDGSPGKVLSLDAGDGAVFDQPVRITVPFNDGTIAVPYYIDDTGHLHLAQASGIDRAHRTLTFDTFHASLFTWIEAALDSTDSYTTEFQVGEDGFQIDNTGSVYNREGECFGISSFSLWYFENKKHTDGAFYPRFMSSVGTDSAGHALVGQNVIATRAFTSITQQWTTYYSQLVGNELGLSDSENFVIIHDALLNTGNPVLIYLAQSSGTVAHSVLATGVDHGVISVYDVNFHNTTHTISYQALTGRFEPYTSSASANGPGTTFDRIAYNGDGSLALTESYQNILADAEQNFASSANATVEVESHTSGQSVVDHVVTVSGRIDSSQALVERLKVLVGSTSFQTDVGEDGEFAIAVTVVQGANHLRFVTQGRNADGNFIDIPNNLDTEDFTLLGNFPGSVIYVTLTWDTNDTDIDTYVIDPTGDYSCYYHKQTADGGFLDYDVVTGYGPEHWLLTSANTVRYGQDYHVRLHYYSDHGNGPSNYTVSIQVGEGANASTTFYRGNLAVSNPSNNQPSGAGADWVDIATIRPVAATRGRSVTAARDGLPLRITVPVPSAEERAKY